MKTLIEKKGHHLQREMIFWENNALYENDFSRKDDFVDKQQQLGALMLWQPRGPSVPLENDI